MTLDSAMRHALAFITLLVVAFVVLSVLADSGRSTHQVITGTVVEYRAGEWVAVVNDTTDPGGLRIALRDTTTPIAVKPGARVTVSYRSVAERRPVADTVWVVLPGTTISGQSDDRLSALQGAEAIWAAHKPKSYEFTIDVHCFCLLAGRPVSFRVTDAGAVLLDDIDQRVRRTYGYYDTIEKLFSVVRRAIDRRALKVAVEYDAAFGYPVQADLDEQEHVADDELFFRVTAFKPIREAR